MAESSEPTSYLPQPADDFLYNVRNKIFQAAMRRNWKVVCDLFLENKQVRYLKITRGCETVLHVAISCATEYIVSELLETMKSTNSTDEWKEILGAKNKSGNTPLHLAAALGREKACHKIAELMPEMITTTRNNLQETPLFTAVRYGKKNAFFVLEAAIHHHEQKEQEINYEDWLSKRDTGHCRRYDGNNILHYAIRGEHLVTSTEPLKLHFNDYKKNEERLASDIPRDDSEVLPTTYKACNLFFLAKELINCIVKTVASSLKTGICKRCCSDDPESQTQKEDAYETSENQKQRRRIPKNYDVAVSILKFLFVFLRMGLRRVQKIGKLKQKHRNANTIMKVLVEQTKLWEYENTKGGMNPSDLISEFPPAVASLEVNEGTPQNPSEVEGNKGDGEEDPSASPVLVAAKRGIREMVESILTQFPVALLDQDKDEKNIVLLAVEHRQVDVYSMVLDVSTKRENVVGKVDRKGNSALHLAAMLSQSRPWSIPGAALQMQWESKWYKYVLNSVDEEIFATINNEGKTSGEIFIESHDTLMKDGCTWLKDTSQFFSAVAVFVATLAFASTNTVPGGVNQNSGFPILGTRPVFHLFAISSLVSLCCSVTSLVMFLAIHISSYQVRDFDRRLPIKFILGFTSLFISIASMLISFCAGDFFVIGENLKFAAYPIYAVMFFPVTFFAIGNLPLYIELIKATLQNVPERI